MWMLETVLVAFSMFSALPVPQIEWNGKNMRYAMCAFPLVGAVIGLACWLWSLLGGLLRRSSRMRGQAHTFESEGIHKVVGPVSTALWRDVDQISIIRIRLGWIENDLLHLRDLDQEGIIGFSGHSSEPEADVIEMIDFFKIAGQLRKLLQILNVLCVVADLILQIFSFGFILRQPGRQVLKVFVCGLLVQSAAAKIPELSRNVQRTQKRFCRRQGFLPWVRPFKGDQVLAACHPGGFHGMKLFIDETGADHIVNGVRGTGDG